MATTEKELKPDIDLLKSKMTKYPEEILMAQLSPLQPNQFFRTDMQPYEFELARRILEDRIAQFKSLFERSVEFYQREEIDSPHLLAEALLIL